mmetsp:Transcript_11552/g.23703  ORF Transcript_11552/g.23703 Transcript_11552/m.23703 type:complete len:707 (-) Transcript_11552:6-2126(-)
MFRVDVEDGEENGTFFHLTLSTKPLAVGRKGDTLDVVFGSDKSCSRSHCTIAVARLSDLKKSADFVVNESHFDAGTSVPSSQFPSNLPNTQSGGKVISSYFSQSGNPSMTPTQTQSNDGRTPLPSFKRTNINEDLVVIVTDGGSKYGTHIGESKKQVTPNIPTILKLGSMGSGIVHIGAMDQSSLRITRIPLVLCFSKVQDKTLLSDPRKADTIGAICKTTWDCRSSTHLITDRRANTGKNIMAWATSRPVVTLKWVEALMAREHGADPIPEECDFDPPGTCAVDNVDQLIPRNKTLENVYLISLLEEEIEELAIAGGAKVKRAHEMSDEDFYETKGSWLKTLIVANLVHGVKKNSVVLLEPRGGKPVEPEVKKRRDYLLETFGIPLTDQTQLATSITEIKGLKDKDDKKDLTKTLWSGRKVAKNRKKGAPIPMLSSSKYLNESFGSEEDMQEDGEVEKPQQKQKEQEEEEDSDATDDEGMSMMTPAPPPPPKASKKRKKDAPPPSPMISKKQKRGKPTSKAASQKPEDTLDDMEDKSDEEQEPPPPPLPEPKLKLGDLVGSGGWLKIAPADRSDYKRPGFEEIEGMPQAETELVRSSILVVRTMEDSRKAREDSKKKKKKKTKSRGYAGPNFSRFRKNTIVRRWPMVTSMKAVLPKESERELALQTTQRDIERRQEEAERLFGGAGGGIDDFLQGTNRNKRRRRM